LTTFIQEEEVSNARFSILQARAVKDKRISDSQFRTLAALGMYADQDGWCFPKLKTLGDDLGKSKQAVGRDTIALRKLGYLEVTPKFRKDGSRTSSEYRLIFDTPRQHDVDTPSTGLVDTPSTSEVDALTTHVTTQLTKEELSEIVDSANKTMDGILKYGLQPENYWKGRECFRDNHLHYADWYHDKTNQVCGKRQQRSWQKAFLEWQDEGIEVSHLQESYAQEVVWRKFITDPNELTKKAIAIKAVAESKKSEVAPESTIEDDGNIYL
jgi:hypothetical protein